MPLSKTRILASGTRDGGGTLFRRFAESVKNRSIRTEICGVASQHEHGGVQSVARDFGVPFTHLILPCPNDRDRPENAPPYMRFLLDEIGEPNYDYLVLLGWTKYLIGHCQKRTINFHPGPTHLTAGLYGIQVHRKMVNLHTQGTVTHTELNVHFVTAKYDRGPVFYRRKIRIYQTDTPESLQARVKAWEIFDLPKVMNEVVQGRITWDGYDPNSLELPRGFRDRLDDL